MANLLLRGRAWRRLILFISGGLALCTVSAAVIDAATPLRPNIVVIMADDLDVGSLLKND